MANLNARNEAARGYLLLGVFFIHGLYSLTYSMDYASQAPLAFALIKILAPQISVFFFLSGMSSRGLGQKSLRLVLHQSVMLIFLAWVSEGIGIIIDDLMYGNDGSGITFIKAAMKPIVYGTGGCTYVTWFFTVLAAARIMAWIFERNKIYFALSWLVIIGLILAAKRLHLPDNLYEWRNWPAATLFVVIGMKFPKNWRVPRYVGLLALVASIALTWFDVPGMWKTAPCLTCNIDFVAQPMVGQYGFLPAFILEQILFFLFMLWAAQEPRPAVIAQVARYFGRASLQFLLLHGWLIVSIEPIIASFFPTRGNLLLLLAILFVNPAMHAFIFKYTEGLLNKVLAACFAYGRSVTDWCFGLAGFGPEASRHYSDG